MLNNESSRRFHSGGDVFVSDGTKALPQADFVQSEVIEFLQAGQFERFPRAIQGGDALRRAADVMGTSCHERAPLA